ncbi:transmembrane, (DUF1218) [Olea europaea subsp. europaea]|uniref:Transmembrane, (DUF1218) n=1 Tax=Olea europaea subsp. europaea TaxID=158383 RepID=A0A8S0UG52_OLEEU|nr:transmembrane, (DUF1218) [Olea europaea subsp. europaea]
MAKYIGFLVCLLITIMDIIAGILGIQAEIAQNKVNHLRAWIFECRDPSYQAFKLGMAAVVLLIMAHVIANLLGGCIFIRSREELDQASPNKQLAAASLVLSWYLILDYVKHYDYSLIEQFLYIQTSIDITFGNGPGLCWVLHLYC